MLRVWCGDDCVLRVCCGDDCVLRVWCGGDCVLSLWFGDDCTVRVVKISSEPTISLTRNRYRNVQISS